MGEERPHTLGLRTRFGFSAPSSSFFLRGAAAAFFLPVSTGSPGPLSSSGMSPASQARWTFSFSPSLRSPKPSTSEASPYEDVSFSMTFVSEQPQCLHALCYR